MEFLNNASRHRPAWLLLALSALLLEAAALHFQYGELQLQPCVLCIYERVAVLGILLAGLLGAIAPQLAVIRWTAMLLWSASAAWGLLLALQHIGIQQHPTTSSCDFLANFPPWARLDEWFPAMFSPTGFCEEIQWRFLGFSMPQTMVAIYAAYLLALAAVFAAQFASARSGR
jgi:protein dithiol:quinone oxidoreductase